MEFPVIWSSATYIHESMHNRIIVIVCNFSPFRQPEVIQQMALINTFSCKNIWFLGIMMLTLSFGHIFCEVDMVNSTLLLVARGVFLLCYYAGAFIFPSAPL